jgi:hypothetical protein
MTTLNNYIFLDENNLVIDIFTFDDYESDDNDINTIKSLVNATNVLRNDNGLEAVNSVPTIKYFGSAIPGYSWDGVDTFIPPKPGDDYMLNYDRTLWVKIPVLNNELGNI